MVLPAPGRDKCCLKSFLAITIPCDATNFTFYFLTLGKPETKVLINQEILTWHLEQNNFVWLLSFSSSIFSSPHIITWVSHVTTLPFVSLTIVFRHKTNLSIQPRRIKKPMIGRSHEINQSLPTYKLPGASLCRSGILRNLAN